MVGCYQALALAVGMWAKTVELQFLGRTGCSFPAKSAGRAMAGAQARDAQPREQRQQQLLPSSLVPRSPSNSRSRGSRATMGVARRGAPRGRQAEKRTPRAGVPEVLARDLGENADFNCNPL